MRAVFFSLFALLVLLYTACGDREDVLLLGDWQATQVLEGTDSLRLDPTEIGFTFRPDNRYHYRSTLRYEEAGTWRYDNGFLFARDTTQSTAKERIVAVEKLTADSLEIRMLADDKERLITFLRE